jgi:hypothetical protein
MNDRDKLLATLLELGNDSVEIANNLGKLGIKGKTRSSVSCPIANYLTIKGYKQVKVAGWILVCINGQEICCNCPMYFDRFMTAFDTGAYPNLIQ